MYPVWIAGVGLADGLTMTEEVKKSALSADLLVGGKRLLSLFPEKRHFILDHNLSAAADYISAHAGEEKICVLVSGDAGFYSYASYLLAHLPEGIEATVLPGVSSMQAFCAKLKISYENMASVSMHGRAGALLSTVSDHSRALVLTGGQYKAQDVCLELCRSGAGGLRVWAGENLGSAQERILCGTAQELGAVSFADLTVLLTENPKAGIDWAPDERVLWALSLLHLRRGDRCGCLAGAQFGLCMAKQVGTTVLCLPEAREAGIMLSREYGQYNLCYHDGEKAWHELDAVCIDEEHFSMLPALLRVKESLRFVLLAADRDQALRFAADLRQAGCPTRICSFGELCENGGKHVWYALSRERGEAI